jgi:hypothetical protein
MIPRRHLIAHGLQSVGVPVDVCKLVFSYAFEPFDYQEVAENDAIVMHELRCFQNYWEWVDRESRAWHLSNWQHKVYHCALCNEPAEYYHHPEMEYLEAPYCGKYKCWV